MHLYSLSLQNPSGITHVVAGIFTETPKSYEVVVTRACGVLELYKLDSSARLQIISSVQVFGVVRSLSTFRLPGVNVDYVVVCSDSGCISILKFNISKNKFEKVHEEMFGRSGCRRVVPGQFMATDPRGRAVMIAAVEKQKFVYVLNRDSKNQMTISSPLEAHRSQTIVQSIVGVDVLFENPLFAAIEYSYEEETDSDAQQQQQEQQEQEQSKSQYREPLTHNLAYYELDLGLNHVVLKGTSVIDVSSNKLVRVPGGNEGPGGVLVCGEGWVEYHKLGGSDPIRVSFPVRETEENAASGGGRKSLIVADVLIKKRDFFFFLLFSDSGDIFKVVLESEKSIIQSVTASYFDSIPPPQDVAFLRNGYLLVAPTAGDNLVFQFIGIGDDSKEATCSSSSSSSSASTAAIEEDIPAFTPRFAPLSNLLLVESRSSIAPCLDSAISPSLGSLVVACGQASQSSIRLLKLGISVDEIARSPLPAAPTGVWTVKLGASDVHHAYIVVSFSDATLVLAIGEAVEEVSADKSGFLPTTQTLGVGQFGERGYVQIHSTGIRYVVSELSPTTAASASGDDDMETDNAFPFEKEGKTRPPKVTLWSTPHKIRVTHCAINEHQIILSLTGGEVLLFGLQSDGKLIEEGRRAMGSEVSAVALPSIPIGRLRSAWGAIATWDTVRIVSLDKTRLLEAASIQALPNSQASSLNILTFNEGDMFVHVGLQNGVLLRSTCDEQTGQLSDQRLRVLGGSPVRIFDAIVDGKPHLVCSSSRPWLVGPQQGKYNVTPLSIPGNNLCDSAAPFCTDSCLNGLVAISGNTLRIVAIPSSSDLFHQVVIPHKATARRVVLNDKLPLLCWTVGADYLGNQVWNSRLSTINLTSATTTWNEDFPSNSCVLSLAIVSFAKEEGALFAIAGIARQYDPDTGMAAGAALRTYRVKEADGSLEFVHETNVESLTYAIEAFQGRILVGVGRLLRIYDLGKKKLLRKCENRHLPSQITKIVARHGFDRIVVGDTLFSTHFVKYHPTENQLYIFADDVLPHSITALQSIDYDSVVAADKFGNIFVNRLPEEIARELETDPTGAKYSWDASNPQGAKNVLSNVVHYHLGDVVTSVHKTQMSPGGQETLLCLTINGGIVSLVPFQSREDIDFFTHLEIQMRNVNPPLLGRDHIAYRSYFNPVKDVIDGDLCEQYSLLETDAQLSIAEELGRTPTEVVKKLEEVRFRV